MPAYRSKFRIRFSYFEKLSISFYKVAVRYHILSYGENVEKFCACTKLCDVNSVLLYASYTVSISWAIVFQSLTTVTCKLLLTIISHLYQSLCHSFICCEQSVKVYIELISYFQNTCTRIREECECACVHDWSILMSAFSVSKIM